MTKPTAFTIHAILEWLDSPELLEQLAAIEHDERWSGWETYREAVADKIHPTGEPYLVRWKRLRETPYANMTDRERESDRVEVRKTLEAIKQFMLAQVD